MKYYLIAGEASGDLHGSNLMKSLKNEDNQAEFRFFGGDLMKSQGGNLVKHYREMAFMGLVDVIMNIRTIARNMDFCKKDILLWQPDVIILIDYAGFNLKIAKFAKANKLKVFFYIAPKVWAWQESRVKLIKKYVDRLFVIFPFEIEYFKKHGIEADYFGNPLNDAIADFMQHKEDFNTFILKNHLENKPIIALLAGSRKHEIERCFPEMIDAVKEFDSFQFVVAGAPSISKELYAKVIGSKNVRVVFGQTYNLLSNAKAAIVTSGTATLETALFKVPEVVVFKTGLFTYIIGKILVKIKFFSLVNIIMDNEVVKELLQFNLSNRIYKELKLILNNEKYLLQMKGHFNEIEKKLGGKGVSERLAKQMVNYILK